LIQDLVSTKESFGR